MQVYKAFLYSERIVLTRFAKYVPLLLLIGILSAVTPYLNRFNPSGVRFPEEMAGRIAFAAIVFGVGLFSAAFASTSSAFEKTDGLHFFLFSSGIDKRMYLLAKLTLPVALAAFGAVVPLALYYGGALCRTACSAAGRAAHRVLYAYSRHAFIRAMRPIF